MAGAPAALWYAVLVACTRGRTYTIVYRYLEYIFTHTRVCTYMFFYAALTPCREDGWRQGTACYLLTREGSALPRREHEAGWEGLRGSPRCSPSGRAPPGPPGRAPANKLGREPREGKGPGRWRAMTLALKRLLGFCGFFPSPQRFLAFHLSCCSGASLLVPTAGEWAGVAGPPASGRGV